MGSQSSKLQLSEGFKPKDGCEINSPKRKLFPMKGRRKFLACIRTESIKSIQRSEDMKISRNVYVKDDYLSNERTTPVQISSQSEFSNLVNTSLTQDLIKSDIPQRSIPTSVVPISCPSLRGVPIYNASNSSYSFSLSSLSASYGTSLSSAGDYDPGYIPMGYLPFTLQDDTPNRVGKVEATITPQQSSNQSETASEFIDVKFADGQNFHFENFEFSPGSEGIKVAFSRLPIQQSSAEEYGILLSKIIHLAPHEKTFNSPVDFSFLLLNDCNFSNVDILYSPTDFMEETRWELLEKYQDNGRLVYRDEGPLHNYVLFEETGDQKRLRFLLRHFCSFVIVKKGEKCRLQKVFVYTSPVYENEIDVAVLAGNEVLMAESQPMRGAKLNRFHGNLEIPTSKVNRAMDLTKRYYDDNLRREGFLKMAEGELEHYEIGGNIKIRIKISGSNTQQNSNVYDAEVQLKSTVLWQNDFHSARFPYCFNYNDRGKGVPLDVVLRQETRSETAFVSFRQLLNNADPHNKASDAVCETSLKKTEHLTNNATCDNAPVELHSNLEAKSINHNQYGSNIPCSNRITPADASYCSRCTIYAERPNEKLQKWELKEGDIETDLDKETALKEDCSTETASCMKVVNKENPSSKNNPNSEMDSGNMACGGYKTENSKRGKHHFKLLTVSQIGVPEYFLSSSQKSQDIEDADDIVRSLDLRSTSS